MIEIVGIIAAILAVAGCIANNRKLRWCFIVWFISSFLAATIHFDVRVWSLLARDLVFAVLAVEGWVRWGTKRK